jgi:hypothetical protein
MWFMILGRQCIAAIVSVVAVLHIGCKETLCTGSHQLRKRDIINVMYQHTQLLVAKTSLVAVVSCNLKQQHGEEDVLQ